jgi:hypothetical protein
MARISRPCSTRCVFHAYLPLSYLAIKEDGINPPVKLVHVHPLNAVLEARVFRLKPDNRLFMLSPFVLVTLS